MDMVVCFFTYPKDNYLIKDVVYVLILFNLIEHIEKQLLDIFFKSM